MSDAELIRWAITTIRELDEMGRALVPGFDSMDSEDVLCLRGLEALAVRLEEEDG